MRKLSLGLRIVVVNIVLTSVFAIGIVSITIAFQKKRARDAEPSVG